jgi:hypothetical protein
MSKALTCPVILTGASTRADGSLGLRFSTPELASAEKVAFMELQNLNLKMLLQPADGEPVELKEVRGQFDSKTPSQRLRGALFVLWTQAAKGQGEFEDFYRREMEKLIEDVKGKLADNG